MKRRNFLIAASAAAATSLVAGAAFAKSYAEDVVAQLVKLGFSNITVETTLLGRIKIKGSRSDGIREIVLNPRTGEILRDAWLASSGDGQVRHVLDDVRDDDHSGSGSGDDNGGSGGGDDDSSGSDGGDDNSGSGRDDDGGRDDRDGRDDKREN